MMEWNIDLYLWISIISVGSTLYLYYYYNKETLKLDQQGALKTELELKKKEMELKAKAEELQQREAALETREAAVAKSENGLSDVNTNEGLRGEFDGLYTRSLRKDFLLSDDVDVSKMSEIWSWLSNITIYDCVVFLYVT